MTKKLAAAVLLLMVTGQAALVWAEPAPWYRWRSRVSGAVVCAQASPGEGWVRGGGPFRDARCAKLVRPPGQ
ncbi:hypothetical protein PY257_03550 [Ramlibacter sp. H39-3-26]|uniref:hypothetical protein n=1 Tax=Curvibacter soli TaxID=3031331 RepID=UPI0023DA5E84|nr:hypothetical protein [Ramlibacter sp. H39-3-26]MDF1484263.1 hypothetical protein [Ramlibacter sp. H39-3-26]